MEKFSLVTENLELRKRIAALEKELEEARAGTKPSATTATPPNNGNSPITQPTELRLNLEEYKRYGRQMIMPEVGLQGQLQLKRTKVLLIGAGGLGCPASVYLAGAGLGTIGIIDHDTVEESNLHRQILHSTSTVGMPKVDSAVERLKDLNPNPKYVAHNESLTPQNALRILGQYDVVFDCTDQPSTRYIISDACVLLGKPLVSASALRSDGQLMVLNNPPGAGPCYRCVFPRPPPPETVLSCGEGGVLGPVVGIMGVLMAMEGIKLIIAQAPPSHRRRPGPDSLLNYDHEQKPELANAETEKPEFRMTIHSGYSTTPFRTLRLLGKRKTCPSCSPTAKTITKEALEGGMLDYVAFCGGKASNKYPALGPEERVEVEDYQRIRTEGKAGWLVDVRDKTQYDMCALEGGINVPMTTILTLPNAPSTNIDTITPDWLPQDPQMPIYFICRLGNDSQIAVQRLKQSGLAGDRVVKDITGGLWEWSRKVDKDFPVY